MTTLHHYTDGTHDRTYTLGTPNAPRECRGLGLHPPADALPDGWYFAQERPERPGEQYRWQDAGYALEDGVSVPQGEWVAITLGEQQAAAKVEARGLTQAHILEKYPYWFQSNCHGGVYPQATADTMTADIADCIAECNRVEDAIDAATDAAGIAAALASLTLPEIGF